MSRPDIPKLLRRHASLLLIVLGAFLLVYVTAEYSQMFWNQRRLEREWAAQQRRLDKGPSQPTTSAAFKDDGLTRLSIPKIDFAAVIVEGTGRRELLLGPGHITNTPAPGEPGNSVISAHRDTFFRHIYELNKGDEILVQRNGKSYRYEVTSKRIVEPTDLSVLEPTHDSRLTLITCYPTYYVGPAPERLVVTSTLVKDAGTQADANASPAVERTSQTRVVH
ncbi:MAG: class D sortase [Acidobacteriaceae bacterium]